MTTQLRPVNIDYYLPEYICKKFGDVPLASIPFTSLGWKSARLLDYIEAFLALFIIIPRLTLFCCCLIGMITCGKLLGVFTKNVPLEPVRHLPSEIILIIGYIFARGIFFSCGIYYINVKGSPRKDVLIHTFAPHSSLYQQSCSITRP